MAKTGQELAQEFQRKAAEFADLIRSLDDEQWQAFCENEKRPVGTMAHHVGQSYGATYEMVDSMVTNSVPQISMADIDAMNAAHASEHPNPDKTETLAMMEESAASVTERLAALDDDTLNKTAIVQAFGADPIQVRTWIEAVVIGHIDAHQPSIETAIGR